MANIFKNKDLFSLKSKGSTFFIRTFADQSNQDVVNGDAGYEDSTAGFLVGNENNLSDEIQQGWALGSSQVIQILMIILVTVIAKLYMQ